VKQPTTAIYAGTFDPPTMGHLDVARRASHIFDRVIWLVVSTPGGAKTPLFAPDERVELARAAAADLPNVVVDSFSGLLVDYARSAGAVALVKGLRAVSDFESEFSQAHMNEKLAGIESVFFMTSPEYAFVSSSLIKQVAQLGGDVNGMVPPAVERALRQRFRGTDGAGRSDARRVPRSEGTRQGR
jgi:pantetheine-phosphate adenylyltransferase